jgi:hypothetical protein
MGIVSYGQSGYDGASMSERAREAYAQGEKPASKWTKAAMVEALKDWCYLEDRTYDATVEKMRKGDMFARLFECTSWHHCSKCANEVDFYGVDEDACMETFAPMSAEELEAKRTAAEAREAEDAARRARERAEREARAAEIDAEDEWWKANGCNPHSIAAALIVCPERVRVWRSLKGNVCAATMDKFGNEYVSKMEDAYCSCAIGDPYYACKFDARDSETYGELARRDEHDGPRVSHAAIKFDMSKHHFPLTFNLSRLWAARLETLNL